MQFRKIMEEDEEQLFVLQREYKKDIREEVPDATSMTKLIDAIKTGRILFYGCEEDGKLVAMCSVCINFSTFNYGSSGVIEDFYIVKECRHKGLARKLVRYAYDESGVSTMTVGCADCDIKMYNSLGFKVSLGNMLAYE